MGKRIADLRLLAGFAVVLGALCVWCGAEQVVQEGGDYRIVWWGPTISGTSSGVSDANEYVLAAVIGEAFGGESGDADYSLEAGAEPVVGTGTVEFDDIAVFASWWLERGTGLWADLDVNEKVDFGDLSILAEYWLRGCPPRWPRD